MFDVDVVLILINVSLTLLKLQLSDYVLQVLCFKVSPVVFVWWGLWLFGKYIEY